MPHRSSALAEKGQAHLRVHLVNLLSTWQKAWKQGDQYRSIQTVNSCAGVGCIGLGEIQGKNRNTKYVVSNRGSGVQYIHRSPLTFILQGGTDPKGLLCALAHPQAIRHTHSKYTHSHHYFNHTGTLLIHSPQNHLHRVTCFTVHQATTSHTTSEQQCGTTEQQRCFSWLVQMSVRTLSVTLQSLQPTHTLLFYPFLSSILYLPYMHRT